MRKLYTLFLLIVSVSVSTFGDVVQIDINGTTREYIIVAPETPSESPRPLIVFLHGLGQRISDYVEIAQQTANTTGAVMLLPQALDEQNPSIKFLNEVLSSLEIPEFPESGIPVSSVWNAGTSIPLTGLLTPEQMGMLQAFFPEIAAAQKIVLNADVDDIGFINRIINDIKVPYNIRQSRIYMFGVSMGGAMTYKYAYSENAQTAAIAVVSGFIGAEVYHGKILNTPVCIFHSEDDEVVPYYGGIFSQSIPYTVAEFIQKYKCTEIGYPEGLPDIANDGISVQVQTYACDPRKALKFYLLSKAKHADFMVSDYKTGPNDIDYLTEIWKFFEETKSNKIEEIFASNTISFFYPNPAKEAISFSVSGKYELKEITGKAILTGNVAAGEIVSIGNIPAGLYLVTLKSIEGNYTDKLIIK